PRLRLVIAGVGFFPDASRNRSRMGAGRSARYELSVAELLSQARAPALQNHGSIFHLVIRMSHRTERRAFSLPLQISSSSFSSVETCTQTRPSAPFCR